ncbi:sulfite exporter TauE/SafE family protein [Crocinitomicaceae bacterium]|nr:sulfite exporter TauE/SafE family protein [Crocinitomicaceae bacterium]MDB4324258.1 sulfite exporter TauE/SafE family protein [Crocinitomicaceae bacterium]
MTTQTILILVLIGISAGILSGFVGVGGGIIIVPALVYLLGMSQFEAQGTSLFVLLLPVGVLAVINYTRAENINWKFGLVVAVTFVIGGYIGSKIALKISPSVVKLVFGIIMAFVSVRLILSGFNGLSNES